MTSNHSENNIVPSPYHALPARHTNAAKGALAEPIVIDGQEYVRREFAYGAPRRARRRFPIFLLLLALGGGLAVTEALAPAGFKPILFAGESVGNFSRGLISMINRQEVCKQAAIAQLELDRLSARTKYDLEISEWRNRMDSATRRLAQEKSDFAKFTGQCGLAALLGPEAAELCAGVAGLRYGPSTKMLEREIAEIRRARPEAPEILSPNYTAHLDACQGN